MYNISMFISFKFKKPNLDVNTRDSQVSGKNVAVVGVSLFVEDLAHDVGLLLPYLHDLAFDAGVVELKKGGPRSLDRVWISGHFVILIESFFLFLNKFDPI